MHTDIDMSGRIEETNKPTVLALANGLSFSILISARDKRTVIDTLRTHKPHWERKLIHIFVFGTLVFMLLKDYLEKLDYVVIDPEYPGYERDIKDRILLLCRKHRVQVNKEQITFEYVGKKSPAHAVAIAVFRGERIPDRQVTADAILREFGI